MKRFSSLPRTEEGDEKSYELYCLLNGVYTNVVYEQLAVDGKYYYKKVNVTEPSRLQKQKAVTSRSVQATRIIEYVESTTTTPQKGTVTTTNAVNIDPVAIFKHDKYISGSSGKIDSWKSSYGTLALSQSTEVNKPSFGVRAGGRAGYAVPYFDGGISGSDGDYMTFNSSVTLEKDFTIFLCLKAHSAKYVRILGSSSDSNIYLGFNEDANLLFHFGLGSGKTYSASLGAEGIKVGVKNLFTIQRSGTTLYVRKDGVQIATLTVGSDDFVFNQLGRIATEVYTLPAHLSHLSIYNGYIQRDLTSIEQSLIKESSEAYS